MRAKRVALVSAGLLAVGGGAGAAIAASTADDGRKAEQSILDNAAKKLGVSPGALRSALSDAENAQLDQAVKDGRLTQAQADAIKARRTADGRVLGIPGGRHGGPGGGFPGGPGGLLGLRGTALGAAAGALGVTQADLLTQLRSGKSIADVAKARSTSLDDVKAAIKDAVTKQLDAGVTAGKLTAAQRTDALDELGQHLDDLVNARPGTPGGPGRFHGPRRSGAPRRGWR